jgi:hypothetical protein
VLPFLPFPPFLPELLILATPTPSQGTPTFTYRSYTIKVGSQASGGMASRSYCFQLVPFSASADPQVPPRRPSQALRQAPPTCSFRSVLRWSQELDHKRCPCSSAACFACRFGFFIDRAREGRGPRCVSHPPRTDESKLTRSIMQALALFRLSSSRSSRKEHDSSPSLSTFSMFSKRSMGRQLRHPPLLVLFTRARPPLNSTHHVRRSPPSMLFPVADAVLRSYCPARSPR